MVNRYQVQYPARTEPVPPNPSDQINPVFFEAWQQPMSQPQFRVGVPNVGESRFFVGGPSDFVVSDVSLFAWRPETNQFKFAKSESARWFESYFHPDWEQIISTPDLVDFATWVQPASQPVLPTEYRYLLPFVFVQIEPDDFVVQVIMAQQALRAETRDFILVAHKRQIDLTADERDFTLNTKQ